MRFIFNFFFFGMLFFLIYYFFPDAFNTLVDWAKHIFAFFQNLFIQVKDKASQIEPNHVTEPAKTLFSLLMPKL